MGPRRRVIGRHLTVDQAVHRHRRRRRPVDELAGGVLPGAEQREPIEQDGQGLLGLDDGALGGGAGGRRAVSSRAFGMSTLSVLYRLHTDTFAAPSRSGWPAGKRA